MYTNRKRKQTELGNETGQCSCPENSMDNNVQGHISDQVQPCEGSHHHVYVEDTSGSRLLMTLTLNFIIPAAQVIGGIYARSTALISDATHNFSDFLAVLIAYFAYRIGKKGASVQNTFGYRRAEIMATLLNVVILMGAVVFIVGTGWILCSQF